MNPFYLDPLNDWSTSFSVQIPVLSKAADSSNNKKCFLSFKVETKKKPKQKNYQGEK